MSEPRHATRQPALIGDRFAVDPAYPLPEAGGGLPAFAASETGAGSSSSRAQLMGLPVQRHLAPRVAALHGLAEPVDGLLGPLAHGTFVPPTGDPGYYVICPTPPGPPLSAGLRPWPEAALVQTVLRPVASVLSQLASRRLTHRAIRLDNVFHGTPGQPVTLGTAWTAPPASLQPAVCEPVYSAMCLPCGRGEGTIADDVYALGVLLIALAIGRLPLAGLDAAGVIRLKLELGSYGALAGQERLPPMIADLARGMLAEDPDHRPPPAMLLDPQTARARRVAARPPRRAQRGIDFAGREIWDCRAFGFAMAGNPEEAAQLLRSGTADRWLRRSVGDAGLAGQVDEAVRQRALQGSGADDRADAAMVMRVIAVLDPLAPLCWEKVALWPDGIGAALVAAEAEPALAPQLQAIIDAEAAAGWAAMRQDRCDETGIRLQARQLRSWLRLRGPCGGLARLRHALNPLLPCVSPALAGNLVVRPESLPGALERIAGKGAGRPKQLVDASMAAFLAARAERQSEADLAGAAEDGAEACVMRLRVLARLQARYHPAPLPRLAAWAAEDAEPAIARWHSASRRTELRERLAVLASDGQLAPMLALLDDPDGRAADTAAALHAQRSCEALDTALEGIDAAGPTRAELAVRLGQEIVAAVSLAVLVVSLMLTVIG
jgi:hypothetical protein